MIHNIQDISDKLCPLDDIRVDAGRSRGLRSKVLQSKIHEINFRAILNV